MFFNSLEAFLADDMFNLAGIFSRGCRINTQPYEKPRQQSMAFKNLLRYGTAGGGKSDETVAIHFNITVLP